MKLRELVISLVLIASINAEYKQFRNKKVYKVTVQSEKDVEELRDMQTDGKLNFWSDIIKIGGDVRIMVAPEHQKEFEEYLDKVGIETRVVIEDVQKLIDDQLRRPPHVSHNAADYDWTYYQNLDEIHAWLDSLAAEYPDIVTVVSMGNSVERRPIKGVKIDYKRKENATIGMIEGGIHAREWIVPATVTWVINLLVKSTDPDVRALAENIVWHIFPVVNPDGYDVFHYRWHESSPNPCSDIYAGPDAFSEPETQAITNYVYSLQSQGHLLYYFAVHSYSQFVLVPHTVFRGADVLNTPNYGDLFEIAIKGMDKLKEKHGTSYRVGTGAEILYPASGCSFDWAKASANVTISYLFELRDVGEHGFLLPADQIIPNSEEFLAGLVEMDRVARQIGYYSHSYKSNSNIFGLSVLLFIMSMVITL